MEECFIPPFFNKSSVLVILAGRRSVRTSVLPSLWSHAA